MVGTPFGMLGRRRYGPGYGPGYGRGGGCGRDLCLLETGCCLAEGLSGNCLVLLAPALPQLVGAVLHRSSGAGRGQAALLSLIATYQQRVSAHRARPVCRFAPSCSSYAAEAIARHGALRGSRLTTGRLLRCRPGTAGGPDPVR
ncbi:MAG: membrane protein insertion efficiency factor YidD [Frankiaceae bacterium]